MVSKATGSQSKTSTKTAKGGGKEPKGSNPKSNVLKKIFSQPHSSKVFRISFVLYLESASSTTVLTSFVCLIKFKFIH